MPITDTAPQAFYYNPNEPLVMTWGRLLRAARPEGINRDEIAIQAMDAFRLLRSFMTYDETMHTLWVALNHMEEMLQAGNGAADEQGNPTAPTLAEHWRGMGREALEILQDFKVPDTLAGLEDE